MPNWCSNEITIHCKTQKDADQIYDTLHDWLHSNLYCDPGFSNEWLGRFLILAGVTTYDEIERCGILCRGSLTDMFQDGNAIELTTETAWCPMLKMWRVIVDKCFPEKVDSITYVARESGCGIYCTNIEDYAGTFTFDCPDGDFSIFDYYSEESLCKDVTEYLRGEGIYAEITDIESLTKELDYLDIDYSLNRFKYVDVDELD